MTAHIPTDAKLLGHEDAKHPAKFSKGFVEAFRELLWQYLFKPWRAPEPLILDPFAGVGTIHQLRPEFITYGMEIEQEWAIQSQFTICGDSRKMPVHWTDTFDAIVTSPTYGNRMADHHERGKCTACDGTSIDPATKYLPAIDVKWCSKCNGTGIESSTRNTYRHVLGRPLNPSNTGMYQYHQNEYRHLHIDVYTECWRVLVNGGLMIVNVSNHIRKGEVVNVVDWHKDTLTTIGFDLLDKKNVMTQRLGFGENHEARVDSETILVLRKLIP